MLPAAFQVAVRQHPSPYNIAFPHITGRPYGSFTCEQMLGIDVADRWVNPRNDRLDGSPACSGSITIYDPTPFGTCGRSYTSQAHWIPAALKYPFPYLNKNLLLGPNVSHRLKQHYLPTANELAIRPDVRSAMRIDEACPVPSLLGVDCACLGYLDSIHRFAVDVQRA